MADALAERNLRQLPGTRAARLRKQILGVYSALDGD
jgi:hypothetical protein